MTIRKNQELKEVYVEELIVVYDPPNSVRIHIAYFFYIKPKADLILIFK